MRPEKNTKVSTARNTQGWTPGLPNHTCSARYPLNAIVDCLELKGFPAPKTSPHLNDDEWAVHSVYTSPSLKNQIP